MNDWFIGKTITGFEHPEGRTWNVLVPAETLEQQFGSREVPEDTVNEWAHGEGRAPIERAIARMLERDEYAPDVYVDTDDL